MLEGITVLDFSTRLPGPLGASLLAARGARVIKVEDINRPDPFVCDDPLFSTWYQTLNEKKELVRLDFDGPNIHSELLTLFKGAQAVIAPDKKSLEALITPLAPMVWLTLSASRSGGKARTLHDLNILALKKILSLHARLSQEPVIAPPFLPVAGIAFGSSLAISLLSALVAAMKSSTCVRVSCSLEQAVEEQLHLLYPESLEQSGASHFLHNGNYPCYNIYRTKDKHAVAFAAIESRLWIRFCQIFNCPIEADKRMTARSQDPTLIASVANIFKELTLSELKSILAHEPDGEDLCITPFEL